MNARNASGRGTSQRQMVKSRVPFETESCEESGRRDAAELQRQPQFCLRRTVVILRAQSDDNKVKLK